MAEAVTARLYKMLLGDWIIDRDTTDMPHSTGRAIFWPNLDQKPAQTWLNYREDIELTLPSGQMLSAYRELLYHFRRDSIAIYFHSEWKPSSQFLELPIQSQAPASNGQILSNGVHLCKLDTYTGSFQFALPDSFAISYRVLGPHKNFEIQSRYKR